jgi:hypothetical protein
MGMTIRVNGLGAAAANVQVAVKAGISNALTLTGIRAQRLVTDNITHSYFGRPPAVDTTILANSINFALSRAIGVSRVVVFSAPPADQYAAYVESGTGRHFPPPSALLLWVKRKFNPADEKEALSIAFLVARAISRRGTLAFGMFARAFAVLEGELAGIFESAIAAQIRAAGLAK